MERWIGKVAVVTGASAGIGAVVSKDLVTAGLIVIGLARRVDRIEVNNIQNIIFSVLLVLVLFQALKADLNEDVRDQLHAYKCDVSQEKSIQEAFEWIEKKFGVIHILINNAGVTK